MEYLIDLGISLDVVALHVGDDLQSVGGMVGRVASVQ